MVAAVLWQRRDRPAPPPVAVKAPEKPLAAGQVPNPAEPEGKAQAALNFAKQSQAAPDFDTKNRAHRQGHRPGAHRAG